MHRTFVSIFHRLLARLSLAICTASLLSFAARAETFISAEPIPTADVIGQAHLDRIETLGYAELEHWANRLLNDCKVVDNVIHALRANHAIGVVNPRNISVVVGAGGFQAVTHPTFVLSVDDTGHGSVSQADVAELDNALGYVLSQGGTVHFSPDQPAAYDFPLDYAVVTFSDPLSGIGAKNFFDFLGTIDPALWSGDFAGFTQINFKGSTINNSMLFLQPATSIDEFVNGLSAAVAGTSGAKYFPLDSSAHPTTAQAGVSFPGNDWIAYPNGDQYLANLGSSSPRLLSDLAELRKNHLQAVARLLDAIQKKKVDQFLSHRFECD
jgi:hypothetical protein